MFSSFSYFNYYIFKEKYRVKWEGYPEEESTWEPIEHLRNVMDKVKEYMERVKVNKRGGQKNQLRSF